MLPNRSALFALAALALPAGAPVNGLSYEEAAVATGCSVKTLSSRLARGRERFREVIAPYLATGAAIPLEKR